jgi:hypothetical protein
MIAPWRIPGTPLWTSPERASRASRPTSSTWRRLDPARYVLAAVGHGIRRSDATGARAGLADMRGEGLGSSEVPADNTLPLAFRRLPDCSCCRRRVRVAPMALPNGGDQDCLDGNQFGSCRGRRDALSPRQWPVRDTSLGPEHGRAAR